MLVENYTMTALCLVRPNRGIFGTHSRMRRILFITVYSQGVAMKKGTGIDVRRRDREVGAVKKGTRIDGDDRQGGCSDVIPEAARYTCSVSCKGITLNQIVSSHLLSSLCPTDIPVHLNFRCRSREYNHPDLLSEHPRPMRWIWDRPQAEP